jgi:hypothetical protein
MILTVRINILVTCICVCSSTCSKYAAWDMQSKCGNPISLQLTESSYLTEKLGVKLRVQLLELIIQRLLCVIKTLISCATILACTVACTQRMVVCPWVTTSIRTDACTAATCQYAAHRREYTCCWYRIYNKQFWTLTLSTSGNKTRTKKKNMYIKGQTHTATTITHCWYSKQETQSPQKIIPTFKLQCIS